MKKIFILYLILICICFCGCSTINEVDEETYNALVTYHETVGVKCFMYIESDTTISNRTKNTFKTHDRNYKNAISNLKIKK